MKTTRKQKTYSRPIKVLVGNAATGNQIELFGTVESTSNFTAEMIMKAGESLADEADKLLLKMIRGEWKGHSAIEGSWDRENNQITSIIPARRLVFPTPVPVYNKNGKQLIGREINEEILRRIEQWNQWEKDGLLQVEKEFHTTDDGKLVSIQFRVAPEKLHPNEVNAERKWAVNNLIEDQRGIKMRDEATSSSEVKEQETTPVPKRTYAQVVSGDQVISDEQDDEKRKKSKDKNVERQQDSNNQKNEMHYQEENLVASSASTNNDNSSGNIIPVVIGASGLVIGLGMLAKIVKGRKKSTEDNKN